MKILRQNLRDVLLLCQYQYMTMFICLNGINGFSGENPVEINDQG